MMVGHQDEDRIDEFQIVSMSVKSHAANVNFMTGSTLDITSSTPLSGNYVSFILLCPKGSFQMGKSIGRITHLP